MTAPRFSPQQEAACYFVIQGLTDEKIALEIRCSVRTTRFHIEEAARRIAKARGWTYNFPRKLILRYYVEQDGDVPYADRAA